MFTQEEIKKTYKEQEQLPKRINAYREVGNINYVKKLEKRLNELNFIINHLDLQERFNESRNLIAEYQRRYGKIEVD